jgi:C4-dicarboxylate transporter DctM subunit
VGAILFGAFFLMMLINTPVGFALGIACLAAVYLTAAVDPVTIAHGMYVGTNSYAMIAIPFFMLAGELMNMTKITDRLLTLAGALVGHIRGSLAQITVVTAMFFGGISGSSSAEAASIGSIMIPSMVKHGYEKSFAVAVTVTSATIGSVIPPSINMVIYGVVAGVSVGELLLGGFIPGVLTGIGLMIVSYFHALKHNYGKSERRFSLREVYKGLKGSAVALLMPFIIVGGIAAGAFTATESSAIAVIYGLVVAFLIYRNVSLGEVCGVIPRVALTSAITMLLAATSQSFAYLLTYERIPEALTKGILNITGSPTLFMLLAIGFLLFLGTFMPPIPAMMITTPLLAPVVKNLGYDPVHFGVVVVYALNIGMLTPPVAAVLFVGCAIGRISIKEVIPPLIPLLASMVVVCLLIAFVPELVLIVPKYFMR